METFEIVLGNASDSRDNSDVCGREVRWTFCVDPFPSLVELLSASSLNRIRENRAGEKAQQNGAPWRRLLQ